MGIFTRFKDIVTANLSAMLDRAEDPDKMVRLMIREMEETLVELKAACAETMARAAGLRRELEACAAKTGVWSERARMAVDKGRDDLAREALAEKLRCQAKAERLRAELAGFDTLAGQAKDDIALLEDKLAAARDKQRLLVQRHRRAEDRAKARIKAAKTGSLDAMLRFEEYERRVERMEAEADLAGPGGREEQAKAGATADLEERFQDLQGQDVLDAELAKLKEKAGKE